MVDDLTSDYNCADAGNDLHKLLDELSSLQNDSPSTEQSEERVNRLENQIRFIRNKCDIH